MKKEMEEVRIAKAIAASLKTPEQWAAYARMEKITLEDARKTLDEGVQMCVHGGTSFDFNIVDGVLKWSRDGRYGDWDVATEIGVTYGICHTLERIAKDSFLPSAIVEDAKKALAQVREFVTGFVCDTERILHFENRAK